MPTTKQWLFPMLLTFAATVLANGLLLAYGYGKIETRVKHLEDYRAEQREELAAARTRIEQAIKELQPHK